MITEGDRRLAYFYTHGHGVLCPECAQAILLRAPEEAAKVKAHYHTDRLHRCGNCMIWIGPDPTELT